MAARSLDDGRPVAADARLPAPAAAVALGGAIRSMRMLKGLKLREVAARVECSESLLSKIENGRVSPSLSMLHRIAHSLHVTVPALFSAPDGGGIVSRSGERPSVCIDRAGSSIERLVPPEEGHLLEGNLHVLAPGGGSEGSLTHAGEEVGFVVEGELELTVGTDVFQLRSGDSFTFRSEIPHRYRNPSQQITRVIWVSSPPTF